MSTIRLNRVAFLTALYTLCCIQTAFAFYNPNLGRWLPRDPLGEADSPNRHGFLRNNPPNEVDIDGRITVKRTDYAWNICRNVTVKWRFILDSPAPCDGYLVQEVSNYEEVLPCPCKGRARPANRLEFNGNQFLQNRYWEAFAIARGQTDPTDIAHMLIPFDTVGSALSRGTAKFFCSVMTGPLELFWLDQVPEAGPAPSTRTQPVWWNLWPIEGPAGRSLAVDWTCCQGRAYAFISRPSP